MAGASSTQYVLLDDGEEGDGTQYASFASFVEDGPGKGDVGMISTLEDPAGLGPAQGSGTISSSVFNLSSTILGSGILIMPFVCETVGIVPFLFLLGFVAAAADYSIELLVKCVELHKGMTRFDYGAIGEAAFGPLGRKVALSAVILQQLGACILYVQIIGAILAPSHTFRGHGEPATSLAFWEVLVVVVLIFPLTMLKTMTALRHTSRLAIGCIVVFAVFIVGNGVDVIAQRGSSHAVAFDINARLFSVLPSITFAFVCHMNVFPIYQELQDRSAAKMSTVSKTSMSIALCVYFFIGLFGYITFYRCTAANLIDDFLITGTSVSVIFDVVRAGLGVALVFSYPVLMFELRHSIEQLLFGHVPWRRQRQFVLNVCILTVCTLLAVFIKSISTVFEFVGATSATAIVYVMPAAFYLRLQSAPFWDRCNLKPRVILFIGLALIPTLLVVAVLNVVSIPSLQNHMPPMCGCIGCDCVDCVGTATCVGTRGLVVDQCI